MATEEQSSPDAVTVVLVDDHEFFRGGLRTMLEENGVRVVGEAGDGLEAVEVVESTAPDVVVMDLALPGISGSEATRRLAARAPRVQVLVLTISAAEGDVVEAIMAGASGYLLKDASIEEMVEAVHTVARGESTINPRIASQLLTYLRERPAVDGSPPAAHPDLSEREVDVLRLLAAGKGNAEIAAELFISPKTVKKHIASILLKLHLDNRIQAAVYAVRSGIV